MKKYLLVVVAAILLSNLSYGTHLMGGEIIATQIQDSTYQIKLTVYRDTLGIPMDQTAKFEVRDSAGVVLFTFTTPQDTASSGALLPLYPYGIEVYYFIDTITLPGSGTYHISFNDCCRNGAIQNMTNPLNESMHLTTTITSFDSTLNSTPFFLVRPVIFLPVNVSWNYNPLPFDPNGDSLVYKLDTPLTKHVTNVAGFNTPPATSTGSFTIDPVTSTISWTASTIGNFDATVLTEEYRDGVKIGEIRRDMQFIVVLPSSTTPYIKNIASIPTDNYGYPHVTIFSDEYYEFSFYAEDKDTGDVVTLEAFGEPFLLQKNKAKFSVQKTGKNYGNEVQGKTTWSPGFEAVRNKPYLVVYRVSDGTFANDQAVMYSVFNRVVGVEDRFKENGIGNIFPNPAGNEINIPMNLKEPQSINVSIYNVNGVEVMNMGQINLPAGKSIISKSLNISSGNYLIVFSKDNELISSQQLSIVN